MRSRLPVVLSLLALAAACEQPAPTAPAVESPAETVLAAGDKTRFVVSEGIPLDVTLYLECTEEDIHFTGTQYQRLTLVDNGDGTAVQRVHVRVGALEGIGLTSGNRYRYSAVGNGQFYVDLNEGESMTRQVLHGVVATSGPHSVNYRVMQLFTATYVDGNYEIDIVHNSAICN